MPNRSRRPRAAGPELKGRLRATDLAERLGVAVRDARHRMDRLQREVAVDAGVSQSWVSLMERGRGAGATLESWASVAAAVDEQLVAYLEHTLSAALPRDHVYLKGQELVIRSSRPGGWRPMPEAAIDPVAYRSRSVDVLVERPHRNEVAVVEIRDWFDDVGAAMRSLDGKVDEAKRRGAALDSRTGGLWVVRATRRNRARVAELHGLFSAKFAGPASTWLRALRDPGCPMPAENGFVWSDVSASRLFAARLGR